MPLCLRVMLSGDEILHGKRERLLADVEKVLPSKESQSTVDLFYAKDFPQPNDQQNYEVFILKFSDDLHDLFLTFETFYDGIEMDFPFNYQLVCKLSSQNRDL